MLFLFPWCLCKRINRLLIQSVVRFIRQPDLWALDGYRVPPLSSSDNLKALWTCKAVNHRLSWQDYGGTVIHVGVGYGELTANGCHLLMEESGKITSKHVDWWRGRRRVMGATETVNIWGDGNLLLVSGRLGIGDGSRELCWSGASGAFRWI